MGNKKVISRDDTGKIVAGAGVKKEDPERILKIIFSDKQDKTDLRNMAINKGFATAGAYARHLLVMAIKEAPLKDKLPRDED